MKGFIEDCLRNFAPFAWLTIPIVLIAWCSGDGMFLLPLYVGMAISLVTSVIVTLVEKDNFECESLLQNSILTLWAIIEFTVIFTLLK